MGFAIGLQLLVALVVILVAAFFSQTAMLSAAAGAAIAIVPNAVFALYLKIMGKPSAVRFFIGEAAKIGVMIMVFLLVWRNTSFQINAAVHWAALIVVLMAHNFSLLRKTN